MRVRYRVLTAALLSLLGVLIVPAPARAQQVPIVPGCVNGALQDAEPYVWWTLGARKGDPAPDWEARLRRAGFPHGPLPHELSDPTVHYGITQQIGGDMSLERGRIAGRLFLPTNHADHNGYYTREVDVLADAPGGLCWQNPAFCVWSWRENQSQAPYAPRSCLSTPGGPPPPPPPPPVTQPDPVTVPLLTQMAAKVDQLAAWAAAHDQRTEEFEGRQSERDNTIQNAVEATKQAVEDHDKNPSWVSEHLGWIVDRKFLSGLGLAAGIQQAIQRIGK